MGYFTSSDTYCQNLQEDDDLISRRSIDADALLRYETEAAMNIRFCPVLPIFAQLSGKATAVGIQISVWDAFKFLGANATFHQPANGSLEWLQVGRSAVKWNSIQLLGNFGTF